MTASIAKVLVANRGEIAVRVMQTCREMGIATVGVYSDADASGLHVQCADEACCIGPAAPLQSYLRIDAMLQAARQRGADAVHPGYGFLAENAEFARRVQEAGLVWIGPSPEVITLLGDKVAAKALADAAGVPVIPGYMGDDQSPDRMSAEAERLGYPVILKAAAGGGGKGMRVVHGPDELPDAVAGAAREAKSAFGDDRIFLEKLLLNPHHVEFQLLFDSTGTGIYLGERECSLQRRHQKVLEESPSPVLTPQLRVHMGEAGVRLARAAAYTNAGTVEFLFAGDQYYFLEMNTRIQVEHPVTEMVTGLDLVRLQIEIAAGRSLPLSQLDVETHGHAIEVRLYAEDPSNRFLPATGRLERYRPPSGSGVRNDVGVYEGVEVTPYYDPILAKLTVHADTRDQAVQRLRCALDRYVVLGVTTNLEFLRWITEQPAFVAGHTDTGFIEQHWPESEPRSLPDEVLLAAAGFELVETRVPITEGTRAQVYSPWKRSDSWRSGGGGRRQLYRYGPLDVAVETSKGADNTWHMAVGGESYVVGVMPGGPGVVTLRIGDDVETFTCAHVEHGVVVRWKGDVFHLLRPSSDRRQSDVLSGGHGHANPTAPMPGTVVKVLVRAGDRVLARQPLLVVEAMKMEHVVEAPHAGLVTEVLYGEGDLVPAGAFVVRLEES